jgi:hypothetical protein
MKLSRLFIPVFALSLSACMPETDGVDSQSDYLTEGIGTARDTAEEEARQEKLAQLQRKRVEVERMYAAAELSDFVLADLEQVSPAGAGKATLGCLLDAGSDYEVYLWRASEHIEEVGIEEFDAEELKKGLLVIDGVWDAATGERQLFIFDTDWGFNVLHRILYDDRGLTWWSSLDVPINDCTRWHE